MRDKINPAVAEVRGDVSAGRLRWTQADVQRLIEPYPKRPKVDAVLAKLEEDTSIPEGECPHEESENESTAPEDSDEQATDDEKTDGGAPAKSNNTKALPPWRPSRTTSAIADETKRQMASPTTSEVAGQTQ